MSQFLGILVEIVYLGDMESYSLKIHTCWGTSNLRHDADGLKAKEFCSVVKKGMMLLLRFFMQP